MKLNKLYAYLLLLLVILFSCCVSTIEGMSHRGASKNNGEIGKTGAEEKKILADWRDGYFDGELHMEEIIKANMVKTNADIADLKAHYKGTDHDDDHGQDDDNDDDDDHGQDDDNDDDDDHDDIHGHNGHEPHGPYGRDGHGTHNNHRGNAHGHNGHNGHNGHGHGIHNNHRGNVHGHNGQYGRDGHGIHNNHGDDDDHGQYGRDDHSWTPEANGLNGASDRRKIHEHNQELAKEDYKRGTSHSGNNHGIPDHSGGGIHGVQQPPAGGPGHGESFDNMYILKSQVVPPVCPACPQTTGCPKKKACQPCAPCARCPEPSFDCKKVPNYNAVGSGELPSPYLNSFSSF